MAIGRKIDNQVTNGKIINRENADDGKKSMSLMSLASSTVLHLR